MAQNYRIRRLHLESTALPEIAAFYREVLKLPVNPSPCEVVIQAGESEIRFRNPASETARLASSPPIYHFAFDIPENMFAQAKRWLAGRINLVRLENGRDEIHFASWNADACYFRDPAGNVLEFIARHNLANARSGPFDAWQILAVSEIGIVVEDVGQFVTNAGQVLGLRVFAGSQSEDFAAIGDDYGLLIAAKRGRMWLGGDERGAENHPLRVELAGDMTACLNSGREQYAIELNPR